MRDHFYDDDEGHLMLLYFRESNTSSLLEMDQLMEFVLLSKTTYKSNTQKLRPK